MAPPLTVELLADRLDLGQSAGLLRWREWGRPPEPELPSWWITTTADEAGRDALPVTLVATADGDLVGCVGLAERDIDERPSKTPWVIGMVVSTEWRMRGVGRTLLEEIERVAVVFGHAHVWVATESARAFYEHCGYEFGERVARATRPPVDVLIKALQDRDCRNDVGRA